MARSLLVKGAAEGNAAVLVALVHSDIPIDATDEDGNTALHFAVARNFLECAALLLKAGANVNLPNSLGWTPLMQAARHGHLEAVQLLLGFSPDVNAVTRLGVSALGMAAVNGSVDIVRKLLDAGASPTQGDLSPVLLAAFHNQQDALRVLLNKGASANRPAAAVTGITPLIASAAHGSLGAAKLLLEHGASTDTVSAQGLNALQVAMRVGASEVASLLQPLTTTKHDDNDSMTALDAVYAGNINKLREILARDPDEVKAVHGQGVTALLVASVLGNTDAVQALLDAGADVNVVDTANSWTPLLYALYHRHSDTATVLLRGGADILYVTPKGHTVFDFACEVLDFAVIQAYIHATASRTTYSNRAVWEIETQNSSISSRPGRIGRAFGKVIESARSSPNEEQQGLLTRSSMRFGLCSCWLGKNKPELNRESSHTSMLDDLIRPLPVPAITELPVLPFDLPRYQPYTSYPEDEIAYLPSFDAFDSSAVTNLSLSMNSVSNELSSLSGLKMVLPGKPPPQLENCSLLLMHKYGGTSSTYRSIGAAASEDSSSVTASSKTTVKTKFSNNTRRATNVPSGSSNSLEQLTLSLGRQQLTDILFKLSINDKADAFREQDIDFEAFLELTTDDLIELGVHDHFTRAKIMKGIQSMRRKLSS